MNATFKKIIYAGCISLLVSILFMMPLWYAWSSYPWGAISPLTGYSALGGILPWNDAACYYFGANHLLETGQLDFFSTRRPLNAILFSIRLWLSKGDFSVALILQALLCGISCLLVMQSVIRRFGFIAGIATLAVLFIFGATFIPTTLSETLGLTLGCLSFVLLFEGVSSNKLWLIGAASALFTIALNTRAGAFFLLPMITLWVGYHFKNDKKFNWQAAGCIIVCILIGFSYNILITNLYGAATKNGATHDNFALTLYGLVAGGKTWLHAYKAFPEFSTSEADLASFAQFLYLESFKLFLQNPFLLLWGLLKSLAWALKILISFFQMELPRNLFLKTLIRGAGVLFSGFSIWRLKTLHQHCANVAIINIGLLATALSASFLWTDGGIRVFAVTVPFFAAAFGIVVSSFTVRKSILPGSVVKKSPNLVILTGFISIFLLSSAVIIPKIITPTHSQSSNLNVEFSCPKDEMTMLTHNISGAPHLNITQYSERFKNNILQSKIEDKALFLKILSNNFSDPLSLGQVYDVRVQQIHYILATSDVFEKKGLIGLCLSKPKLGDIPLVRSFQALNTYP